MLHKAIPIKALRDRTKMLLQNLVILNFPLQSMQEKHSIQFCEDMFDIPNHKAFQVVAHFLFTKVDEVQAAEIFRKCYPISNKSNIHEFNTACMNWWNKISEQDPLFKLPRVTRMMLKTPGGAGMIELLFSHSIYALYQESNQLNGEEIALMPPISSTKNMQPVQVVALKSYCHSECLEYVHTLQMAEYSDVKFKQEADTLVQEYRELEKKKEELKKKKENYKKVLHELYGPVQSTPTRNTATKELGKYQKNADQQLFKVLNMWRNVLTSFEATDEQRKVIESVVDVVSERENINANRVAPRVPSTLLQHSTSQFFERVGTSLYEAGQLNLVSMLSLFNLCLELITDKLHEVGVPNFESKIPYVNDQSQIHSENVSVLKKILDTTQRLFPDMEQTVKEMKTSLMERDRYKSESLLIPGLPIPNFPQPLEPSTTGIGILPSTPPFKFTPQRNGTTSSPLHNVLPKNKETLSKLVNPYSTPNKHLSEKSRNISVQSPNSSMLSQGTPEKASQIVVQRAVSSKKKPFHSNIHHAEMWKNPNTFRSPKPRFNVNEHSLSVPSTPISDQGEMKIEKITSRTPEAVRTLIDQMADYTMTEMFPEMNKPSTSSLTPGSAIPLGISDPISRLEMILKENEDPNTVRESESLQNSEDDIFWQT